MTRERLAWTLLWTAIVYALGFYFIGAAIKPGYSQLSDFISEYNATGTAWACVLTYVGFAVMTVLLSIFLWLASSLVEARGLSRVGTWLLWAFPASYLIAVVAPCDAGCPVEGSNSQMLHNLLGVVTYFAMGVGVFLLGFHGRLKAYPLRRAYLWLTGLAFPIVFVLMVQPELGDWAGLMQRLLDLSMAVVFMLMLSTLIERPNGAAGTSS
ncbi:MAG: DUF998 domain-containing protein [Pseudomonadota bacterium]